MKNIILNYKKSFVFKLIFAVNIFALALGTMGYSSVFAVNDNSTPPSISIDSISDPISGNHTSPFNFNSCQTNPLFNPVSISGNGTSSSNPQGQNDQYRIQVDWGDGTIQNSSSDPSNVSVIITPNDGSQPFTFTFSAGAHTYSATGNFTISAKLYHQTPPGKDGQGDASIDISTCIHVPPPTTGSVTVHKIVVNDNGGGASASDYTLKVGDTTVVNNEVNDFPAATYAITESGPAGYTATYSGDCDASGNITVAVGQIYSCTITNNDDVTPPPPTTTGTLTVTKIVSGGTATTSDFMLFIDGIPVTSGVATTTSVGSHVVSEATTTNYTGVFSDGCDSNGNVTVGTTTPATCILTNIFNEATTTATTTTGTLTVTKIVIGGTATTSDFALFVDGISVTSGVATTTNLGNHVVSEATTTDYTGVFSGSCDSGGNVTVGTTTPAICILTNTFNEATTTSPLTGSLTVTKIIHGGTATTSDFALFVDGMSVTSGVATTTSLGVHVVSEATTTSYTGVFGGDCDSNGNVTVGTSTPATCTLTNTFNEATTTATTTDNGGSGYVGGIVSGFSQPTTEATSTVPNNLTCSSYISDYLRIDLPNNPTEVTRLQAFLKTFEGETNLPITGIFDQATLDAVTRFQTKYQGDILSPWGYSAPTGYVYILTKKKINELFCNAAFPLTDAQQSEIDRVRALVEQLRQSGAAAPATNGEGATTTPEGQNTASSSQVVGEAGSSESTSTVGTNPVNPNDLAGAAALSGTTINWGLGSLLVIVLGGGAYFLVRRRG